MSTRRTPDIRAEVPPAVTGQGDRIGARAGDRPGPYDRLPDVRDGLTRIERVVLFVLRETQAELGGRRVPTTMLYGRVVEHVNISEREFQAVLTRMVGRR